MGLTTINTSGCVECEFCTLDESNKARIMIYCSARDKTYTYGQRIPCEDKKQIKKENNKLGN